jgi:hypothetical protein
MSTLDASWDWSDGTPWLELVIESRGSLRQRLETGRQQVLRQVDRVSSDSYLDQ